MRWLSRPCGSLLQQKGAKIEWKVAEKAAADTFSRKPNDAGIKGIEVTHQPPKQNGGGFWDSVGKALGLW